MSADADDKHRELAKSINDTTLPGTQIVYLADTNHFRHGEIYGAFTNKAFWDELDHNGKTNILAVEKYASTTQPIFDAYYKKEITRDEFMSAFDFGSGTGQITADEDRQVANGFADVMDKGVRVVTANNAQGLGGENLLLAYGDSAALALDKIYWLRENKDKIEKDPKAMALQMMEQNDREKMPKPLLQDYIEIKAGILNKIDSHEPVTVSDISALYKITNPHYADLLKHGSEIESTNIDISNRRARDDQVVATIQQAAEQPNSRVFLLYGVFHAGGPDGIMAQLRQNGLQAELTVPYLGKDHFTCMKPNNEICAMVEKDQSVINNYIKDSLRDLDYTKIPDINSPLTRTYHKVPTPES